MVNGIEMADAHLAQKPFDQRQIAQQSRAAVALHHFLHRAAEVDIDDIEAQILADARGVGHHRGIGAEELRGNGMLVRLESQVFQGAGGLVRAQRGADAVRTGELGHDEPASAQIADKAAEYGVGDARHGREHGRRCDWHASDHETGRETPHEH